ncbi:MAG: DUF4443 domain-containing protein [Nitrososphaerota archaeon]
MSFKKTLDTLALGRAPGPRSSFSVFDIIKSLEIIAEKRSVGRGKIAEELCLGEGTTRTLINRLTDAGLIVISKSGCSLTEKGEKIWNELKAILPQKFVIGKNELTFAACSVALLVKGKGEKVKKGLEQRDAAVAAGAKGATTFVFKDNRLTLPMISTDVAKDYPITFNQIIQSTKPEENDVVIISSADHLKTAEYGALAAAWSLI